MIIQEPEAFKTWLTAVLKPMCEADPAALAKYVLALIKKDKSEEELQRIMVGQLEVFLENETESFVSKVLRTLESQDYITTPVIPNANPPNPAVAVKSLKESKQIVHPNELPSLSEPINGSGSSRKEHEVKRDREMRQKDVDKDDKPRSRGRHRSNSRNPRSRSRSWDRSKRSKSRDRDHSKRDRPSRTWRNKSPPPLSSAIVNQSSSSTATSSTSRRFNRRSSRSPTSPRGGGAGGGRGASRSPKHRSSRSYRNRTPPRSLSRSRSRSLEKGRTSNINNNNNNNNISNSSNKDSNSKEHHSRPDTPTQDSNHGDTDFRLGTSAQSIQSVIVQQQQQPPPSGGGGGSGGGGANGQSSGGSGGGGGGGNKRRCRDFDEKGYCMRGEMCPFDHGIDPVVLEDSALSSVLSYNPNGGVGEVGGVGPLLNAPPLMGPRGVPSEYNPQAPQMWNRPGFRGPRPMVMPRGPIMGGFPAQGNMQRELIPVPVLDNKQDQAMSQQSSQPPYNFRQQQQSAGGYGGPDGAGAHDFNPPGVGPLNANVLGGVIGGAAGGGGGGGGATGHGGGGFKKKTFDFNRLGPRSKNPTNSSLELRKIPQGLNTITHLNNHFSKFGKPVNIQVNYEGDPEAAIITFSSHAEANAAYRSTEAVLNNRFIKVFWHNANAEGKQENVPPRPVKERLGIAPLVPPNTNKVLNLVQPRADNTEIDNSNNGTVITNSSSEKVLQAKPVPNKEETKAQAAAAIKKSQELLAAKEKLKKNQDEKRKEVLKINNNLRKRKQELLEKQLSQQKILIEKMEKLSAGPQRDLIMGTIKKTQESIEEIKKDLLQSVITVKANPQKKNKEDVQREMLDAELDLITKQQEGADTSELQKKLIELKAKAAIARNQSTSLGLGGRGGRGRRFNPIVTGRHLLTKNNLIDSGLKGNVKSVNKAFQKHTVDHRPTRLLVSGYEGDEQESVLNHFQTYGEIVDHIIDPTLPSITLNYKTRKEAEMALLKGKHFQDRTLSITWCNSTPITNQMATKTLSRKKSVMSESEEDQLIEQSLPEGDDDLGPEISEEALLQEDEEEDDEGEERSWRR